MGGFGRSFRLKSKRWQPKNPQAAFVFAGPPNVP